LLTALRLDDAAFERTSMSDSTDSGAVVAVAAVAMVGLLIACGAGLFVWQRQTAIRVNAALVANERAAAEVARAQALANRERQVARAAVAEQVEGARSSKLDEDSDSIARAIRDALERQQRAWNAGDIPQFMESYWKSDKLTFSSAGAVKRTWQGVLESYQQRYPSRREMGELSLDNLEITPLGAEAALVLGDWKLTREGEDIGGNFTLVFRRLDGKWLIVHDHTSRTPAP
jgi:beta-aspartyl-peptidase (threonine type)